MRILIAGTTGDSMPPPYGGVPKVSLLYGRTWKKGGNDVAVVFVYRPKNSDDFGANAKYFFEYGSRPTKLKKLLFLIRYFYQSPFLYLKLLKSYLAIAPHISVEAVLYSAYGVFMDKVIGVYKPDVIVSEAALIKTYMVAQIAKRHKIPILLDAYAEIHDQNMGVNKHLNKDQQRKYWTSFLSLVDVVSTISNCSIGALSYLPPEKVKVFYDTCDFTLSKTEIMDGRETLRTYFKLPRESFLFGAIGAFHLRKGHDHLIKAVAALSKQGLHVGAVICGFGDSTKWKELARKEGIEDNVYFFQDLLETDLIKLHRSLDVYCNLSNSPRSCGLDLALLEAMASNLPVVVYNNGGLPEAVPQGKNGFIVPTNDIKAVSEAFLKLYKLSASEREEMGKASNMVASKTDINLTAEIKLGWLKELVDKSRQDV